MHGATVYGTCTPLLHCVSEMAKIHFSRGATQLDWALRVVLCAAWEWPEAEQRGCPDGERSPVETRHSSSGAAQVALRAASKQRWTVNVCTHITRHTLGKQWHWGQKGCLQGPPGCCTTFCPPPFWQRHRALNWRDLARRQEGKGVEPWWHPPQQSLLACYLRSLFEHSRTTHLGMVGHVLPRPREAK